MTVIIFGYFEMKDYPQWLFDLIEATVKDMQISYESMVLNCFSLWPLKTCVYL